MKTRKRIWALLLAAALMITLLPAAAFAEAENSVVRPVSAVWTGNYQLRGVIGTVEVQNLDTYELSGFRVKYSDGTQKDFTYLRTTDGEEDGQFYESVMKDGVPTAVDKSDPLTAAFAYLDDSREHVFMDGKNPAVILLFVPYLDKDGYIDYERLDVDVTVYCWEDEHPKAVKFVTADGSVPECWIGFNYLYEDLLYGEGNKFVVSYTGWDAQTEKDISFDKTYIYAKGKDASGEEVEGFYYKLGDDTEERFTFEFTGDQAPYLEKGYHDLGALYSRDNKDTGLTDTVEFTVQVNASKYGAYAYPDVFAYTGKAIKPKFRVYDSDDNLIPASEYTYEMPDNKEMGWYEVEITFNDKEKYVDSIMAYYGIGPKAPKLTKLVSRKNGLTVKWKIPSTAQMKNYDGMYIEVSTDKHFMNNYKSYKVSKKAMKNGCRNITKLKKNKKYYVRAYAYKNITQDGETYQMISADSNILTKKTK